LRDGGSKIVAYSIEKRQENDRWVRCNFTDVSECQYTVTGLSPGDRYEFRIIARNAVGTISPPSQSSGIIMTRDENGKYLQLIFSESKNILFLKIAFGPM
jgi:titin